MRAIYHFGPAVFDPTYIWEALSYLPEVASVRLTFRRPSEPFVSGTAHLVDVLEINFLNRSTATVDGVFLWKFRDSIPPCFGDDSVGFLDANPFGPGHVEDLLGRVRDFHDALFVRPTSDEAIPLPPLRVEINRLTGKHRVVPPARLSPATQDLVTRFLVAAFPADRSRVDAELAPLVANMLQRGRLHYELRPSKAYPGRLQNTQVFAAWPPAALTSPVEQMLSEFCPLDSDWGPTPSLGMRVFDVVRPVSGQAFAALLAADPAAGRALRKELGLTGSDRRRRATDQEVLEALSTSTTPTLLEDVFFQEWLTHRGKVPFQHYATDAPESP